MEGFAEAVGWRYLGVVFGRQFEGFPGGLLLQPAAALLHFKE